MLVVLRNPRADASRHGDRQVWPSRVSVVPAVALAIMTRHMARASPPSRPTSGLTAPQRRLASRR
jgi:hypothetical protein